MIVVDAKEFKIQDFVRFVDVSVRLVCKLVPDIAAMESHLQLIKVIHAIIMRLDGQVRT